MAPLFGVNVPLYCGSWADTDTEQGKPFNLDLRHPVDYPGITFTVSSVRTMLSLQQVGPDSNLPLIETRRVTLREAREDSNGSLHAMEGGTTVEVVVRADRNLIHCSESAAEAQRELGIWFTESEIISYRQLAEETLYDINLDGILE
jgi:hypothetical protein